MTADVQHWLYPINPKGSYVLTHDDGLETAVDPQQVLAGIEKEPQRAGPWILSTGYKTMQVGDAVWVYVAGAQQVCALASAGDIYFDVGQGRWFVRLHWDLEATRKLMARPILREALDNVLVYAVRRAKPTAAGVLERWLADHRAAGARDSHDVARRPHLDPEEALSRTSRRRVRGLDELAYMTGCADDEELWHLVDGQMEMRNAFHLYETDNSIELHTSVSQYSLPLPCELGRFWRTVDLLDLDLVHQADLENLPEWPTKEDQSEELAHFFGTPLTNFVGHVGGQWYAQDADHLVGINDKEYRWFGSGRPLQVLLGIGLDEVVVSEPLPIEGGLLGPPRIENGRRCAVPLRRRSTLRRLGQEVRDLAAWVSSGFTFCPGCRTEISRGAAAYCRGCHARYFGTIID